MNYDQRRIFERSVKLGEEGVERGLGVGKYGARIGFGSDIRLNHACLYGLILMRSNVFSSTKSSVLTSELGINS